MMTGPASWHAPARSIVKEGPSRFMMARWRVEAMLHFLKALQQLEVTTVMGMKYDSSH
jgi:hypothetical protein